MAGTVGEFAVIGTYNNFGLMAGVMGTINTNTCQVMLLLWRLWMAILV
jgi:hypothetical protein